MTSFVRKELDPTWLAAALLGSVWAAVEIILGSFLHNLSIPFSGTLLAAIGTSLVVAGSHVWGFRGLIWRSGLVCALMKSISPSAVILGPMVGIMLEAAAIELSVRLMGRNPVAYLVGGILAVTMPLMQKIVGIVIMYGWDMARLYVAAFDAAKHLLGFTVIGPAELLVLLLVMHATLGAGAAMAGYFAGKRTLALPVTAIPAPDPGHTLVDPVDPAQKFSLLLLFSNAGFLAAALATLGSAPLWLTVIATFVYGTIAFARYPSLRKRLRSPRIWIEITLVALLAGVLLGDMVSGSIGWSGAGLRAGVSMALRAVLVVTAFSAISVELRNPRVVDWFLRRGMGQLAAALEVAFEALPFVVRVLGEQSRFLREPLQSIIRLLSAARGWLGESCRLQQHCVFILSGDRGSGKTRLLTAIAETLLASGKRVGGILAPVVQDNGSRLGYDVLDLQSGRQVVLCRRDIEPTGGSIGPFHFAAEGIRFGGDALSRASASSAELIMLDEVGPLEFDGGGWGPSLDQILSSFHGSLLLVVRPNLVHRAIQRWSLSPLRVWDVREVDKDTLTRELLRLMTRRQAVKREPREASANA